MTEQELAEMIDQATAESIENMNALVTKAEQANEYYACELRGDEEDGYSSFTSSQVADVIDSDMPTLARIFLGAGQVVEFLPTNPNDADDAREAQEKTIYIEALIKSAPDYYRVMHGALMGAVLHPVSVLRYGFIERKTTRIMTHNDATVEEFSAIDEGYREQFDSVEYIEYEKDEGGLISATFRLKNKKAEAKPSIRRVKVDDFILSYDATSKADARIIGERMFVRRGDLVAEGYKKSQISEISTANRSNQDSNYGIRANIPTIATEWASELVEGFDGFIRCDYNEDGIIETRHVIKFGDVVLLNEEIDDDPRAIDFAFCSATLLPDNIIGMSRAERVAPYQDVMTTISRAMLDNTAQITRGRMVVNTSSDIGLNFNDVTGDSSIIRANPRTGMSLNEAAIPLLVQSVSTEALTVIQYLDAQRAQSTGGLMANQGLKEDALHKETATRFKGVDDSAQAKVELVVRTIAETMIKDLYEGFCYYAQKHSLKKREMEILGKTISANPALWTSEHDCRATVGTGYGDNDKTIETLNSLLSVSANLQGTGISDGKKLYNLVAKLSKASGIYNVSDFFNDPEKPAQMLTAENEALKQQVQQLQQQQQAVDPILQLEQIRASARIEEVRLKNQVDMLRLQLDQQKLISANALKLTEMEQAAGKQLDNDYTQNEGEFQ